MSLAVVIPCYRCSAQVGGVIAAIPATVAHIVVVDDACPDGSGLAAEAAGDPRVTVIRHPANKGVGGAVVTGYRKALDLGATIIVKIDGDGQMDPGLIDRFVAPLASGRADYAKGNRFRDFGALRAMPKVRLFGNSMLSFMIKAASGYWSMMDPTNGYTAIHAETLRELDLDRLAERYFFESDMLINLNAVGAVVENVAMAARYGDETSSLSIPRVLIDFPPKILRGMARRVFLRYFVYEFGMASVYIALGLPMTAFSFVFGLYQWLDSLATGVARPTGTVMLVVVPLILGFQMLLQAVAIDMGNEPKRR